jgi:hypothetical protein
MPKGRWFKMILTPMTSDEITAIYRATKIVLHMEGNTDMEFKGQLKSVLSKIERLTGGAQ